LEKKHGVPNIIPPYSYCKLPAPAQKDKGEQDDKMSSQQTFRPPVTQKRLLIQKLPINSPLVLKDSGKLKRLVEVALWVMECKW
jgi:hypothetical protein